MAEFVSDRQSVNVRTVPSNSRRVEFPLKTRVDKCDMLVKSWCIVQRKSKIYETVNVFTIKKGSRVGCSNGKWPSVHRSGVL